MLNLFRVAMLEFLLRKLNLDCQNLALGSFLDLEVTYLCLPQIFLCFICIFYFSWSHYFLLLKRHTTSSKACGIAKSSGYDAGELMDFHEIFMKYDNVVIQCVQLNLDFVSENLVCLTIAFFNPISFGDLNSVQSNLFWLTW